MGQVVPSLAALQSGKQAWSPALSMVKHTASPGQAPTKAPHWALQMPAGLAPPSGKAVSCKQNSPLATSPPAAPPSTRAVQGWPMSPLFVVNGVGAQTCPLVPELPLELEELLAVVVVEPLEPVDEVEVEAPVELEVEAALFEPLLLELVTPPELELLCVVAPVDVDVLPVEPELWDPVVLELPDLLPEQAVVPRSRPRDASSARHFMESSERERRGGRCTPGSVSRAAAQCEVRHYRRRPLQ